MASDSYRWVVPAARPPSLPPDFSQRAWVRYLIDSDARFNADGAGIRAGSRIESVLDGDVWQLRVEDWRRLHGACEDPKPRPGWRALHSLTVTMADGEVRPAPDRLVLPYMDAIRDALKAEPAAEAAE